MLASKLTLGNFGLERAPVPIQCGYKSLYEYCQPTKGDSTLRRKRGHYECIFSQSLRTGNFNFLKLNSVFYWGGFQGSLIFSVKLVAMSYKQKIKLFMQMLKHPQYFWKYHSENISSSIKFYIKPEIPTTCRRIIAWIKEACLSHLRWVYLTKITRI